MTFQLLEASQETGIDILGALKDMIEKTGFAHLTNGSIRLCW